MEKYIPLLSNIGLSESEAKIFLANIQLGPSSAIQLAQKTGLTRQMVYTILPRLIEKGLMKEIRRGKRRYFQTVDVAMLKDYTKQIEKEVKEAIPLLKREQAMNATIPEIQIYENPISMREAYRYFMREVTANDVLLLWVTNKVWMTTDKDFLKKFVAHKNTLQIHDKIIAPDTQKSREYAKRMNQPYAEYRFMRQPWHSNAEKWIWRDMVMHFTISENATNLVIIKSEPVAELERAAFNLAWRALA